MFFPYSILLLSFYVTAAAVPHFRALMAMTDHKSSSFESDQASSDSSRGDLEQPVAPLPERGDKIRINNGSAKTK